MRITPNHPRLRVVAVSSWLVSAWLIVQLGMLSALPAHHILLVAVVIAAVLLLAVGIAFWALGTDCRAGVVFDAKGLMLNLGHSAAFVCWDQISELGISRQRTSLLALGSSAQFGIRLRDPDRYIQSYEVRLPASQSLLGCALRWLGSVISQVDPREAVPTHDQLDRLRAASGYDVLIPEAFLGGKASAFLEMVELYRQNPGQRRSLELNIAMTCI